MSLDVFIKRKNSKDGWRGEHLTLCDLCAMNFRYGKKEIEYLKSRDRRFGEVIDQIGRITGGMTRNMIYHNDCGWRLEK